MLKKEDILKRLQNEWNKNNEIYSEDGFKEHIENIAKKILKMDILQIKMVRQNIL